MGLQPVLRRLFFLVFCFGLEPGFIHQIFDTLKAQFVACPRRGVLETYGKVLFRAWRHAQADPSHEAYLARLEDCIQQAMHAAVHARSTSLFGALRHVLAQFHAQKAVRGVDEMLKRLYEGFLWRSLVP